MDEDELGVVVLCLVLEVLEAAEDLAGEGAAEVAEEDEDEGAFLGGLEEGLAGGELVGFCGFLNGVGGGAGGWDAGVCADGGPEDEGEGWDPDEIVKGDEDEGCGGECGVPDGDGDDECGGEKFDEAEEDDGPVAEGVCGGDEEGESEEAGDEAEGAPEHGVVWALHADGVKALVGPEVGP